MTYLEKLTELLKEVEPIKKDLEELRFGTKIILKDYLGVKTINQLSDSWCSNFEVCVVEGVFSINDVEKIIGNNIQDHHLRMYIHGKGSVEISEDIVSEKYFLYINLAGKYSEKIQFNYTKPLNQQSEEVLKDIYNYLTK